MGPGTGLCLEQVEQDYSWAKEAAFEVIAWTMNRTMPGPVPGLWLDQDYAWSRTRTMPGPRPGLSLDQGWTRVDQSMDYAWTKLDQGQD